MKGQRALIAGLVLLAATSAWADKLLLKSGSYLTGQTGVVKGDKIVFTSDDLGELEVSLAQIVSLAPSSHTILYVDGARETQEFAVSNGVFVIQGAPLPKAAEIKTIDPEEEKWHGSVNVTFMSSRGNSYEESAAIRANVNRRWEKDRFRSDFAYDYGKTGTTRENREKTTDKWAIEAQHDHFWTPKFFTFENGRYEQDDIAGLDDRLRLGAGVGLQWLDNTVSDLTGKWSFSQEAGLTYFSDNYREKPKSTDEDYVSFSYAHHLFYFPKWLDEVKVFHNLAYYPQVDDWEHYNITADLGLSTELFYGINLLAKIEWDYNSRPSEGRKSSDFRSILGLGYGW